MSTTRRNYLGVHSLAITRGILKPSGLDSPTEVHPTVDKRAQAQAYFVPEGLACEQG